MVDINIIHVNLIDINTGGSMKIKNEYLFVVAQSMSRLALKTNSESAWKAAMMSLAVAYGL